MRRAPAKNPTPRPLNPKSSASCSPCRASGRWARRRPPTRHAQTLHVHAAEPLLLPRAVRSKQSLQLHATLCLRFCNKKLPVRQLIDCLSHTLLAGQRYKGMQSPPGRGTCRCTALSVLQHTVDAPDCCLSSCSMHCCSVLCSRLVHCSCAHRPASLLPAQTRLQSRAGPGSRSRAGPGSRSRRRAARGCRRRTRAGGARR